eukprot:8168474-Prorocentrum_lima.AAC.1
MRVSRVRAEAREREGRRGPLLYLLRHREGVGARKGCRKHQKRWHRRVKREGGRRGACRRYQSIWGKGERSRGGGAMRRRTLAPTRGSEGSRPLRPRSRRGPKAEGPPGEDPEGPP